MDGDNPEASDVMDCLIEHKHNREMDEKCQAGIEHHQIVGILLVNTVVINGLAHQYHLGVSTFTFRSINTIQYNTIILLFHLITYETFTKHFHETCQKHTTIDIYK